MLVAIQPFPPFFLLEEVRTLPDSETQSRSKNTQCNVLCHGKGCTVRVSVALAVLARSAASELVEFPPTAQRSGVSHWQLPHEQRDVFRDFRLHSLFNPLGRFARDIGIHMH